MEQRPMLRLYSCAICKLKLTETISPGVSIIAQKKDSRKIHGTICPACASRLEDMFKTPATPITQNTLSNLVDRAYDFNKNRG